MPSKDTDPHCGVDQDHGPHPWAGDECPGSGAGRKHALSEAERIRAVVLDFAGEHYPGDYDGTTLGNEDLVLSLLNRIVGGEPVTEDEDRRHLVLRMIDRERDAQDAKWGKQLHPDGTGRVGDVSRAEEARLLCQTMFKRGRGTWRHVADEEIAEAYAETDPVKLLTELIQVGAVFVAWAQDIAERLGMTSHTPEGTTNGS